MTVTDLTQYLKKRSKQTDNSYNIHIIVNKKDPTDFEYSIDPAFLLNTADGIRFVMYHLSEIAVDLCYGMDPSVIAQLQELLENDQDY